MFERVSDEWNALLELGTEAQRLIEKHPLRLYFGADARTSPIFFLRTSVEPDLPLFSNVISVELRERPEQKEWTVLLTLQDDAYRDTFIGLCVELARLSERGESEEASLAMFYRALNQLRTIFQRPAARSFSAEEQRGLVAELWFALHVLALEHPAGQVLTFWKGPYDAPQDFRLESGQLIEVKATHAESRSIKISSAEQLDPSDCNEMFLALVGLEELDLPTEDSVSLPSLITDFFSRLTGDDDSTSGLEDRLKNLRISDTYLQYSQRYAVVSLRVYSVSEGFPRVMAESIPLGVDQLNYRIQIAAIRDFQSSLYGTESPQNQ